MPLGRLGGRCLCRKRAELPVWAHGYAPEAVLAHGCAPGAPGWPMPVPKTRRIASFGTRMCSWGVWVADACAENAWNCQFWHTDMPLECLGGRCLCRNRVELPVLAHGCAPGASGWPMPVPKPRGVASFGTRMCPWGVWVADACAETGGCRVVCRCRCRSLRKPAATAGRRPGLCGKPRQRLPSPEHASILTPMTIRKSLRHRYLQKSLFQTGQ